MEESVRSAFDLVTSARVARFISQQPQHEVAKLDDVRHEVVMQEGAVVKNHLQGELQRV